MYCWFARQDWNLFHLLQINKADGMADSKDWSINFLTLPLLDVFITMIVQVNSTESISFPVIDWWVLFSCAIHFCFLRALPFPVTGLI